MSKKVYIVLFIGCLFAACKQDKVLLTPVPLFPSVSVQSNVSGQLLGENGQPLSDTPVQLNALSTTTDQNGFFYFEKAELNSRRAFLKVSSSDYFPGGRAFIPQANSTTSVKIKLIGKTEVGVVSGSSGGQVEAPGGALLQIPSNAIIDPTGNGFMGEVLINAHYFDPIEIEILEEMPGDLKGMNAEGVEQILETYGMLTVDLTDDSNQHLRIVPGKKMEIRLPIPAALFPNAPATIPLWYFDEIEGTWKEEGMATRDNNEWVGTVGKTGFWNWSIPHDLITVKGLLKNGNNNVLTNIPFKINVPGGGTTGFGYSGIDGTFIINLPLGQKTDLEITDECGDIVYAASIVALDEDILLGDLLISNSSDFVSLSGSLLDCNENLIKNGYVLLEVNSKVYTFGVVDGIFKGHFNACSNNGNIAVVAFDLNNQKQSEPLQINLSSVMIAGEIVVCQ